MISCEMAQCPKPLDCWFFHGTRGMDRLVDIISGGMDVCQLLLRWFPRSHHNPKLSSRTALLKGIGESVFANSILPARV